MTPGMKYLQIEITEEMHAALSTLRKRNDRTLRGEVRDAIAEHLRKNGIPYEPQPRGEVAATRQRRGR